MPVISGGVKKESVGSKPVKVKESSKPLPSVSRPSAGRKRTMGNLVLNYRERRIDSLEKKALKREEKLGDMSDVSDRLRYKKAMASDEERHIIDNIAETGTALSPLYKRFFAFLLDMIVVLGLSAMVIVVSGWISGWMAIYILVGWLYFTLTEATFGRGFGKRIFNLYVTNMDFEYISIGASLVQSFFKVLPVFNIFDAAHAIFHPLTKQRLSNKWSDTVVIMGDIRDYL